MPDRSRTWMSRVIVQEGAVGARWLGRRRGGDLGSNGSSAHLGSNLRGMALSEPSNLLEEKVYSDLELGCTTGGQFVKLERGNVVWIEHAFHSL